MIEVKNLVKKYGDNTAVRGISFTIESGHVYGFLGPNGAGKSTTMNIMTGCLASTSGEVIIDGHDIVSEPEKAKASIGYLPEQPPLYFDMTPSEYLRFVGSMKGLKGEALKTGVDEVIEKTGLAEYAGKTIRNLSKGYKQRVGIAQAVLGDPEVIILDEPTVGLDPIQIVEIRELIEELGKTHTVILSSHILSEVSTVCDRLIIISKGRVVADAGTQEILTMFNGAGKLRVVVRGNTAKAIEEIKKIASVQNITCEDGEADGETVVTVMFNSEADIRAGVFSAFVASKCIILEMTTSTVTLENVFMELTENSDEDVVSSDDEEPATDETSENDTPDEDGSDETEKEGEDR